VTHETTPVDIPDELKLAMRLEAIFMPFATNERRKLYEPSQFQDAKFVHYTTAEAALGIITRKRPRRCASHSRLRVLNSNVPPMFPDLRSAGVR